MRQNTQFGSGEPGFGVAIAVDVDTLRAHRELDAIAATVPCHCVENEQVRELDAIAATVPCHCVESEQTVNRARLR